MNQFYSFLRKEFKHILRDSRTVLILLVMPLVLICLFGFAISTEVRGTRVAVLNQNQNEITNKICDEINANNYFSIVAYLSDNHNIDELIQSGKVDLVLILNKDLGIQILADGSEPNLAQTRTAYLTQIIVSQFNSQTSGIRINSRMLFNPQMKSEYNFVPGVIGVILLLICVMMTSISIVKEKEMGTMEILLASPLSPLVIIISKLLPYLLVSSINLITILLLAYYVLGIPIAGSVATFCLLTIIYILVALAIGLLISNLVSSQLAAMLISLLTIVPAIYLSGMIFPLESMPIPAQRISLIIPTRWFIDGARKILIQGVDFEFVAKDIMVLAIESVVLIAISLKLFKKRLE